MSFQDFGPSKRSLATTASATPQRQTGNNTSGANSMDGTTTVAGGALNQISEVLLQYQRNVGILEKIVHSLSTNARQQQQIGRRPVSTFYSEELNVQYKTQVDVVNQLQEKVQRLLKSSENNKSNSAAQKTALTKLSRDFERVQSQAQSLQRSVTQLDSELRAANKQASQSDFQQQEQQEPVDHLQQVQLQLQQDRLAEEIMREREEEIRNINRGMHQVNEIYKDLAHIVGSQQEQVDNIETQMEQSKVNAESGLKQVEKANEKFGSSQCVVS